MCFYELFCYLNIFFPFCKSETSKKFWFLPWRIVTMPKSFLGWWFLFFFSLRNIHNTKQQLVTLQPQRPILMFSSAITVWGLVGIWGCRFRSKCSVGTAGRKKISKCWLQETNNSLKINCHLDLIYNFTGNWQLLYLVLLVLRSCRE